MRGHDVIRRVINECLYAKPAQSSECVNSDDPTAVNHHNIGQFALIYL